MQTANKSTSLPAKRALKWSHEWTVMLEDLTDAQMGRLFRAAAEYDASGLKAIPDFKDDTLLGLAWKLIRPGFDANYKSWVESCKRNKQNRNKGNNKDAEETKEVSAETSGKYQL